MTTFTHFRYRAAPFCAPRFQTVDAVFDLTTEESPQAPLYALCPTARISPPPGIYECFRRKPVDAIVLPIRALRLNYGHFHAPSHTGLFSVDSPECVLKILISPLAQVQI